MPPNSGAETDGALMSCPMRQSKRCSQKYDVEVLSLEGSYLRTDARRAVIRDGDETCSVEEYVCRHFRRRGYSAVRVENDPIFALFGVLMWPVIQDPSDPRRRSVGVFDRRAVDAGMKIAWTHRPSDFGKPEYGVRRAKAIEKHLSAIICEPQELRQLFDLWLGPSDELGLYLGGRRPVFPFGRRRQHLGFPLLQPLFHRVAGDQRKLDGRPR
jgi:hypothetical protein